MVHADGDATRQLEAADEALGRFDLDAVVAHLSAAIRSFTAAGEPRQAAMACVRLGDALANGMGNLTAGRAWFTRAARLVADEDPCLEQGWVAVAAMGCDVGDPDELLACAELALDRARRFGDLNLETKALADGGLAHVQAGRVDEGFAMLDEAMALACGPADDGTTAAKSACSFFTACYYTSAFERADTWSPLMRQHGLIGADPGGQVFLGNHCASLQGALLAELGRWQEAEAVLVAASSQFESTIGAPAFHSSIILADLRIRQGRLTDAEQLLGGREQAFEAHLPSARLHLARGDHALAAMSAGRGLRALAGDRPRAIQLLEVLVLAEVGAGDLEAADRALSDLRARSHDVPWLPSASARVGLAAARLLRARGEIDDAIAALEDAIDDLDRGRVPWRRGLLLIELARLREAAGDRAGAELEARAAKAVLDELDVTLTADDADVLERLAQGRRPSGRSATLARTGTTWTASHDGTGVQLRDSKGIRYLAELLSTVGVERHALDLVDRIEGVDPARAVDRRRLGDAGPALDAAARSAYRRRVEELRTDIDDALTGGRLEEAEQLQGELDHLVRELAAAFGVGGRERPGASAAERARLNVTRSLRTAVTRLGEALPEAAAALDRGLRTGLYCRYEPGADDIEWIVQSGVNGTRPG